MIERRLREASASWFPPTPSLAEAVAARLPAEPDAPSRFTNRRRGVVAALAALALAGTAVAASLLDVVPGVRIQRVGELPPMSYGTPFFGERTTAEGLAAALPFEPVFPAAVGEPDAVYLDRDVHGSPVATAVYGGAETARAVLSQWRASAILFDKLVSPDVRFEYLDVHGAAGIWIEGGDHAVFYFGRSATIEGRVAGYLTGNVLVWHRGQISYRLELGGTREQALELAGSLRPLG